MDKSETKVFQEEGSAKVPRQKTLGKKANVVRGEREIERGRARGRERGREEGEDVVERKRERQNGRI